MTIRAILSFFFLLFCFYISSGQSSATPDSLITALHKTAQDTNRVNIYLNLSSYLLYSKMEESILYADSAYQLASSLSYPRGVVESLKHKGDYYLNKNDFKTAKEIYSRAIKLSEEENLLQLKYRIMIGMGIMHGINRESDLAGNIFKQVADESMENGHLKNATQALNNLAIVYSNQGKYQLALAYQQRTLKILRKLNDLRGLGYSLHNIGNIYINQQQYEKAEEVELEAIGYFRATGNLRNLAGSVFNMGCIYLEQNKLEQAMNYLDTARQIAIEAGDLKREVRSMRDIARIHLAKNDPDMALKLLKEGIEKLENQDGTKLLKASIHQYVAEAYLKKGNFSLAKEFALECLAVNEQAGDKEFTGKAYNLLTQVFTAKKDFKAATIYYQKLLQLEDTLALEKFSTRMAEMQTLYEMQEKAAKIEEQRHELELLEQQNELAVLWRNFSIVGALVLAIGAFSIYYFFRQRSRQKQLLLESQQKINEELVKLDELKSQFFANISHEFRTPLTLIQGPIKQYLSQPANSMDREAIQMMDRNTDYLLRLVNQMLDLSGLDAGILRLEPTQGDLFAHLRMLGSSFISYANEKGLLYQVNIPVDVLVANFDGDKLEKIIYNLLSNAFKNTDRGGTVKLEANYENHLLKVMVEDSGRGIPEGELPRIFDRFYQVGDSARGQIEGTGIGLSLVKELVSLMKGNINVKSRVNQYTRFVLTLPVEVIWKEQLEGPSMDTDVYSKGEYTDIPIGHSADCPIILVVEDHPDMRKYIANTLSGEFNVIVAFDGEQGLSQALEVVPDLIISDLMMPGIDGLYLCQELKKDERTNHIPVIILTAKADRPSKISGLEIGADGYLAKPFDNQELLATVKNLITQRQHLREKFGKSLVLGPKNIPIDEPNGQFLHKVQEYLEENLSDSDFGVAEMQTLLGMSKTQLYRKMGALTDHTPGEFLRNYRLKRAAQILAVEGHSVAQTAYTVGFNNLSYFSKCFQKLFGIPPSKYASVNGGRSPE